MSAKLKFEDVFLYFKNEGYELLSKTYKNCDTKMEILCPKNHKFFMNSESFKAGDRCPICKNINSYYTYDYIKEEVEKRNFKLISETYINSKEKLEMECVNGHKIKITWNQLNSGEGCKKCFLERHKLKYDMIKSEIEKQGYVLVSENYEMSCKKLKMICLEGHLIQLSYGNFRNGIRCRKCSMTNARNSVLDKKRKSGKNLLFLFPEIVEEWDYELNDIDPCDVSPGSSKKYMWICPNGHDSYLTSVSSRTGKSKTGCPICSSSKGEKRIRKFLKKNNIVFIHQFRFEDCKNKNSLPFDFMIIINNENIICEFDGIEHFEPVKIFGGYEKYLNRIKNDEIKRKYCIDKNIKMINISYLDFDNTEKILEEALSLQGKED